MGESVGSNEGEKEGEAKGLILECSRVMRAEYCLLLYCYCIILID